MASPISTFRKYRRPMLAVLGVLLMIAFSLGGLASFDSLGRRDLMNPVAVSTAFGDYRESDLQQMRAQRRVAAMFTQEAWRRSFQGGGFQYDPAQFQAKSEADAFSSLGEREIVTSRVLAHLAEQQGMVVSDAAVTDFLKTLTRDQLSQQDYEDVLAQMRKNQRVSKSMVFEALRIELLAIDYRNVFFARLEVTPAQRWDYYQRLHRRVRVELTGLKAEDFVAEVPKPTEAQLRGLYDEFKDVEPQLGSPDPGFKIPDQYAFTYLEAHYDAFFDPASVTDADVKAQYEKTKERFPFARQESINYTEEDKKPAGGDKPADKGAAEPGQKKQPPAAPPGKPEAKKPADGGASIEGIDRSSHMATSDARAFGDLTAARQARDSGDSRGVELAASDDPPPSAPGQPSAAPAALTSANTSAEKPAEAKPAETKPAETKPAETKPAASSLAPEKPTTGAAANASKASDKPAEQKLARETLPASPPPQLTVKYALPRDVRQGPDPKYEPLWKIETTLRNELARERAAERMNRELVNLQGKLREYSGKMIAWEQARNNKDKDQKPKPEQPDLKELAKSVKGVTAGEIELTPLYELAQKQGLTQSTFDNGEGFLQVATKGMRPYHMVRTQDTEGNRYLVWMTAETKARVPELSEPSTKETVEHAWKMREARKSMLVRAKELAAEARKANKSLKDGLANKSGIKVGETPLFSWMTTGSAGVGNPRVAPRLSEIEGVTDPGPEFMRTVFDLKVGDIGVAVNHPQTEAYVVRVTSSEPLTQVLRDQFLADRFDQGVMMLAQQGVGDIARQWLNQCFANAKVVWHREAYEGASYD